MAMKIRIFGRAWTVTDLPSRLNKFLKVLLGIGKFKKPFRVLSQYISRSSSAPIEFKDGTILNFSSYPSDICTAFVVFFHQDYGVIPPNSIVVDIGANIGMFSLYAVKCGAAKVFAFEPNKEAFEVMRKNIQDNHYADRIFPFNLAVTDHGNSVRFPVLSSSCNKIASSTDDLPEDSWVTVDSATLEKIMNSNRLDRVDLLKMDCEGSEYDIFSSLTAEMRNKIGLIRMECHGPTTEQFLANHEQYDIARLKRFGNTSILWLTNKNLLPARAGKKE
jgi:FkbM family methyltransferase